MIGAWVAGSALPDLLQLNPQPGEQRARIEAGGCIHMGRALGRLAGAVGAPHLLGLLLGDQQPAELGAVGLVAGSGIRCRRG